jgi:hypothetical protein
MKTINKILTILFLAAAVTGIYSSCDKDETGTPRIDYVRITAPESSDSLLVAAGQGRLIAIMGDHLENTIEIWFNDQRSVLTPTYITKTSILVSAFQWTLITRCVSLCLMALSSSTISKSKSVSPQLTACCPNM